MKQLLAKTILLLLLSLLFSGTTTEAIQCTDVVMDLAPCVSYLMGGNGSPSVACCTGLSTLASVALTTADRRTACGCLVSATQGMAISPAAAQALPSICGINLPFTVSPSMDCSKIS